MEPSHAIVRTAPTPSERARGAGGEIEEIRVQGARALEIEGDHSSVEPAAGIAIGGGKILLVAGQWLDDPDLYGSPSVALDEDDELFGTVFPCEAFTARRDPTSGEILSIRIEGRPLELPPSIQGVELTRRRPSSLASWFLDGRLEDLPAILGASGPATAPQRRTSSGLFYAGTKDEVRLGDRVRVKRWLRSHLEGVVSYVPGLSRYRRALGSDQWAIRLADDDSDLLLVYAPDQVQPPDKIVLVERGRE